MPGSPNFVKANFVPLIKRPVAIMAQKIPGGQSLLAARRSRVG
jgi:hypothetical protein